MSIFGIAKKGLGLLGKKKKIDLKKIHDKYFEQVQHSIDKGFKMKKKGKDIVKEGLKGLGKHSKKTAPVGGAVAAGEAYGRHREKSKGKK